MRPLPVSLHPDAEAELEEAVLRYETQRRGVGVRFAAAIAGAFEKLASQPELGPWLGSGLRRLLVPGFPYGVVYVAEAERVVVLAVAHGRRRPGYWRHRR